MSYKSLQEGMAVGNAFMQAGLSIGKTKKDLEDRELDAEDREIEDLSAMHASELSKNYKARQADPSIAEYHPKPTNAKEAKAYHKGGLLFVKSMTDELNLDTARQKNQSEKYRSEMEELAKKTRNWYTITNEKEAYQAYREIHNKAITGNNITSVTDDGIATVQPADNNRGPYTIQLTRESMTKALAEMLSDPKEVMAKRAAAILHARNHNLEAQENAQLYTRENKDGTTSTIWQVKGQLKPGTDELEPTYFTSDYPPYDNVKLDKNVIGDLATWKKADAVMTEKEKAAETLATKTAEEGLEGAKATTRLRGAQADYYNRSDGKGDKGTTEKTVSTSEKKYQNALQARHLIGSASKAGIPVQYDTYTEQYIGKLSDEQYGQLQKMAKSAGFVVYATKGKKGYEVTDIVPIENEQQPGGLTQPGGTRKPLSAFNLGATPEPGLK